RDNFPRILVTGLLAGGAIGLVFAFGESGPLGLLADLPLLRGFRVPARYLTSWSLALALASALVLSALARRTRRPALFGGLCALVLSADLVLHARRAAPTAPSAIYSVEPAMAAELRPWLEVDEVGFPRRVWSVAPPPQLWFFDDHEKLALARRSEPLYGALGTMFGFEMVGGAGPSPARWKSLFLGVQGRKAELAGAGAVVLPVRGRFDARRFSGLPRAIVVPEAIVVPPSRAIAAVLDDRFDPRRAAILEAGAGSRRDPAWTEKPGSVRLIERGAGHVELAASVPADGILVVFNTYEKGWRSTVDGKPQPVLMADAAFQGVRLPPGEHVVDMRYRPRGLAVGIAAATLGVLGVVIWGLRMPRP
ncbi:MAG TPA: YfhO family protein, partial [Thermoanaerobaculia bacterium]|nr:YfhO family protein [Thermoanaerobaculia bacterium]